MILSWAKIVGGLVSLFNSLAKWAERREYRQAGRNEEKVEAMDAQAEAVQRANKARVTPKKEVDDKYLRRD